MILATDKSPYQPPANTTAARFMNLREKMELTYLARVRESVASAKTEKEPILINTLPALLENMAQVLDVKFPREIATEGTTIASEHGGERARITRYSPAELIQEFQILRDVILKTLSEDQPLKQIEIDSIIKSIDQAMVESLTAYFLIHQGLREQLTMILTHDLRNPLTAIRAASDMILRHPGRIDQVPLWAARIGENVRRIDRMTEDLLDASRVRFGEKIHFEVAPCELRSLTEETLAQLATIHGDRFTLVGDPVQGYWNGDAFKRAIENLVTNALKYGDPTKPITIRIQELHGRAIVSVRNEGAHIPPEEQETLFRSYMRSQSAQKGKNQGWGLGLAMVRGMAEGHGGSITVDSAPDRGTTFIIDVPVDARPHVAHPLTPGT